MIFAFVVSFLSFFHVNFVGDLYISELLLTIFIFFKIKKIKYLLDPLPNNIIKLGIIWLLSQIITDFIRDTSLHNMLRGWSAICFFVIDFCAIYIMTYRRISVVRIVFLGKALGTIFSVVIMPTEVSDSEPWKFGFGVPVTMLVFLFLSRRNWHKSNITIAILFSLGIIDIYLNARSLGGITILTALLIYLGKSRYFSNLVLQQNAIKKIGFFTTVTGLIVIILYAYQFVAEAGYLPDKVTRKYQMGKASNLGVAGLIIGGRPEILISYQAVLDSPIIGHGSWAADPKYTALFYDVADELKLDIHLSNLRNTVSASDLIPIHSVVMQAWVWAGVLGLLLWIYLLRFVFYTVFKSLSASYSLQPLVICNGLSAIWVILFSPFGSNVRFSLSIILILLYTANTIISVNDRILKIIK